MDTETALLRSGISATVRSPKGGGKFPVIVLCHGFCGVQQLLLPSFAESFAEQGFLTVCFDYRGFGKSEGERGRLIPEKQIEDIKEVIEWIKNHPAADEKILGLWGTSLGGCHVFEVAAKNPEIRFVISQLAFSDGEELITGNMPTDKKTKFKDTIAGLKELKDTTKREKFVSIDVIMNDRESKKFFDKVIQEHPSLSVKIPFLTVYEIMRYKPYKNAARVNCPVLVILAENDTVNPVSLGLALYQNIGSENKTLFIEPDANHYDVYEGEHLNKILNQQIKWLKSLPKVFS